MTVPLPCSFQSGIRMSIVMPRIPETGTIPIVASTDQAVLVWNGQNAPSVANA